MHAHAPLFDMPAYAIYPSLIDCPVLISGGATGIGATLVTHFAMQGARVAFIDIDDAAAHRLVARLESAHRAPVYRRADVTDLAQLEATVRDLSMEVGPFRVLLNNAANDTRRPFAEVTPKLWDEGFAVNLRHQFFMAQYVAEGMKATGGSIINLGSISWMLKQTNLVAYATAKSAVQGLTRTLARELGPWKIRANTLVPGWTMTERQLREHLTDEGRQQIAKGQCLAGPLEPEHIARAALFLASDDSEMCTGQEFIVDGGWV